MPSFGIDAGSGALLEYYPRNYLIDMKTGTDVTPEYIQSQPYQAKKFAVIHLQKILHDIAQGHGEYLATYCDLAGIKDPQAFIAQHKVLLLSMENGLQLHYKIKKLLLAMHG